MTTKTRFLVLTLLITSFLFGQNNTFPTTGNVGIGTTTPTVKLDVNGQATIKNDLLIKGTYPTLNPTLYLGTDRDEEGYIYVPKIAGVGSDLNFYSYTNFKFNVSHDDDSVYFRGMTLDKWGTLHISDENPIDYGVLSDAKLKVKGNIEVKGHGYFGANTYEGGSIALTNDLKIAPNDVKQWQIFNMTGPYGTGLNFWAYYNDSSKNGSKMTLLDNGNLGVGTVVPVSKLDVRGVISAPEIAFRNTDGGDDSEPALRSVLLMNVLKMQDCCAKPRSSKCSFNERP